MTIRALALAAALCLSACQTPGGQPAPIITPARCSAALTGIDQTGQLVQLLASFGIAPDKAAVLAGLLGVGKLTVASLCAIFATKPVPEYPDSLPPPVSGNGQ